MLFYCYSLQTYSSDILYLYGRKIVDADNFCIESIDTCKSVPIKITVDCVKSPTLAICKKTEDLDLLEADIKNHFCDLRFIEQDHLKNIFYEDLDTNIAIVRFAIEDNEKLRTFESKYCEKILEEFSGSLETLLISKKIKTPCVLKLKSDKTYIKMCDIIEVIKTDMPRLNVASFDLKLRNNDILSYSICINEKRFYAGCLKNNLDIKKKESCSIEIFNSSSNMYNRIQEILSCEDIDVVVFFNNLGNLRHNLKKFIMCDMFSYASANLKCREFTIEELCEYFKIPFNNNGDLNYLSKILYELFIVSDALLLSKELSELSGLTINKVLSNNRTEIIEYALFHEFHAKKYLLPPIRHLENKPFCGGLVLDPVKGCYDNLLLLLDFNSLYPSIIQEYNICFSNFLNKTEEKGILPKILGNLVKRRREVMKLSLSSNNNVYKIRQKALKILANSIYGSLGCSRSRFCNYEIASCITEKGRDILLDTKKTIEDTFKYKVIYGDTDSIVVDTGLMWSTDNLIKAKEIAAKITKSINKKYKFVEIELEKIFFRFIIYAKKKYIGKYVDKNNDVLEEYKGIDSVKRNCCLAAVDILNKVNKILLSNDTSEIYELLEQEIKNLQFRDKKDFVINNILSKPLKQYKDNIPLPFIHLCRRLKEKGIIYKVNDIVSYVIGKQDKVTKHNNAYLITEDFVVDIDYYVKKQILPSLLRSIEYVENINIERIYKIFNIEMSNSAVAKACYFTTNCCKFVQQSSKNCKGCGQVLTENFYIKALKHMISLKIEKMYSQAFECKVKYDGLFYNCIYCSNELHFYQENLEFDRFLCEMITKFTELNFEQVLKYISMHLDTSKFRVYDLKFFFEEEHQNYKNNNQL